MAAVSTVHRGTMVSFIVATILFFLCASVTSVPTTVPSTSCRNPIIRKEWRTLSSNEKKNYLLAVACILTKPSISPKSLVPGAKNRYDDLVATHINQTMAIHYVGSFLPWHRYYTAFYENMLRKECGYTGAQPYWDWTQDVVSTSKFLSSPVFDPVLGFGGNGPFVPLKDPAMAGFDVPGRTGGGCVQDGPFKYMTVNMGGLTPGSRLDANPRCLSRDFSPYFAGRYLGTNQTQLTMAAPDFYEFDKRVEGGPGFEISGIHGGGHYGVGGLYGSMGDLYSSPTDPIFWLHHANLDRVWWSWQAKNLNARLKDFNGPSCLLDYYRPGTPQQCANQTMSQPMNLGFNHKGITVADTMNIKGNYLCYDYDKLY